MLPNNHTMLCLSQQIDKKCVSLGCAQVQVMEKSVPKRRKVKRLEFSGEGGGGSNLRSILVKH